MIRTLAEVENSIDDTRKSPSAEIKEVKCHQAKIKTAITEMQSQMHATMARMDKIKQRTNNIED